MFGFAKYTLSVKNSFLQMKIRRFSNQYKYV